MQLKTLLTTATLSLAGTAAAAEITNVCLGGSWESCYILIDGPIDATTVTDFAVATEEMDGGSILLNSPGGDYAAAMALGRMIRGNGYATSIGAKSSAGVGAPGICQNACLFALAGGDLRSPGTDSELRFGWSDEILAGLTPTPQDVVHMAAYLSEMGVSADLMLRPAGSGTLTRKDLETLGLTYSPPTGFTAFTMEPYGDGLVVVSKRINKTYPYDRATQLTIYCRNENDMRFLLTAQGDFIGDNGDGNLWFETTATSEEHHVQIDDFRTWTTDTNGFVELTMNSKSLPDFARLSSLRVQYAAGRAWGGVLQARVDLSVMDQNMLTSTLRSCI
jgi:hypothetical protein